MPIVLRISLLAASVLSLLASACAQSAESCPPPKGVALQVLGSGGPGAMTP